MTNVIHPGASPDERCDEDAIQRREWLEPVALGRTSSPSVYTSAAGRNPSVPSIVIQPSMLWWAATARVSAMNLVEGVPTGGVGNEGLGLPSVGSTVKPSRFTWTPLRMLREADEEEVAIEAGLLDAAVVEDREGLAPDPRPWTTHSGGCAPSAITLSSSRVPSTLAGTWQPRCLPVRAVRRRSPAIRTDPCQRLPGLGRWCVAAEHHIEDLPQDEHAEHRDTDGEPAGAPGSTRHPSEREHPREGRSESVGRRTGA
jgi:hypothetical protein